MIWTIEKGARRKILQSAKGRKGKEKLWGEMKIEK